MAERVLSADELREAFMMGCESERGARADVPPFTFTRLRAVEAAVLAKCIKINGMYGIDVRPREGVTEREARKRERAAFTVGWNCFPNYASHETARDIHYPLPTKRVPRTVTLSDGSVVSRDDSKRCGFRSSGPYEALQSVFVYAKTPADARLLADLVERPYDEVPDDGPRVVGTL